MGTGRSKPPPLNAAPAQANPHPRLQRLAREVGAEIPLPPAKSAAEPQPAPAGPRPRSFWFTLINPDSSEK
jgi:hypothetical protein